MQPAIELLAVTKVYGGSVRALDAASLRVAEGEHCALLGPNGAGKTTIIRLLQGAILPTEGMIRILGAPTQGNRLVQAKRQIGVVPQSPGLYPDLTVQEYLEFIRRLYERGDEGETARRFGLNEYLHRPLAALSGGLQRRLLVAAAVLPAPALLLLDEPTVGLDPLAAAEIRALLRDAMSGRTALMSTHNLAEAEELCDTVIIVRRGAVLVHERIEDLRRQIAPRVHLVARQGPEAVGRALAARGVMWDVNECGVWAHVEHAEEKMPQLLRSLLDGGLDIYECRLVPPSLEDLFVDVVRRS